MGQGRKRGRNEGGPAEDQYGERFQSQDRDQPRQSYASGQSTGGGDAGGMKRSSQVSFQRHVPKFLQAHMHLLGKPASASEDEPGASLEEQPKPKYPEGDESDDDNNEGLQRAVAEEPSLAHQYPQLGDMARKAQASEQKEKGNAAFIANRYEEAIAYFSRGIELDPSNEILFGNRAAALIKLQRFAEAARDAKRCTQLAPDWVKGWARLGAALVGMEDYSGAVKVYQRAVALEPNQESLQQARHKAEIAERRQSEAKQHKFRPRTEVASYADKGAKAQANKAHQGVKLGALSFADDDDA